MAERIYRSTAYESHEGAQHVFEVFDQNIKGAAPYVILLDGSFLATAESGTDIAEEITSTREWFGWGTVNPIFA